MIIPNEITEAARNGDIQTVEQFLDTGGDVNAVDARGITLLYGSVVYSQVDMCRMLVARGADPNKKINLLRSAAYVANGGVLAPPQGGGAAWSASASGKIYQILIESGANLNRLSQFHLPNYARIYSDESDSESDE